MTVEYTENGITHISGNNSFIEENDKIYGFYACRRNENGIPMMNRRNSLMPMHEWHRVDNDDPIVACINGMHIGTLDAVFDGAHSESTHLYIAQVKGRCFTKQVLYNRKIAAEYRKLLIEIPFSEIGTKGFTIADQLCDKDHVLLSCKIMNDLYWRDAEISFFIDRMLDVFGHNRGSEWMIM